MSKITNKLYAAGVATVFSFGALTVVASSVPAYAQGRQDNTRQIAQAKPLEGQAAQTQDQDRRKAAQGRLDEAKLRACQNREKAIQNILTRFAKRGAKQLEVFSKITDRTQAFYVEKGKTLANYDQLVAELAAKKAAAQAASDAVKSTSIEFKCDGDNPKGVADSFKASLKTQNAALKEYKLAVKNLIVGVKSVQSTTAVEGTTEGGQQ